MDDAPGNINFGWDASAVIDRIFAGLHATSADLRFRSSLLLTDIPTNFDVNVGRDPAGGGPTFAYEALGTAQRMDLLAAADGSLPLGNGSLSASLFFNIIDLVPTASAAVLSGGTLALNASGAIREITAQVSAYYDQTFEDKGTLNEGKVISFPWWYRVHLSPSIDKLTVLLRDVSKFTLKPGVVSTIRGEFSEFYFGWQDITVPIEADATFDVLITWPEPLGTSQFGLFWLNEPIKDVIELDVFFERYSNDFRPWIEVTGQLVCDFSFSVDSKPGRLGGEWNVVALPNPSGYGDGFFVTPNPAGILPTWLTDVITFLSVGVELAVTAKVC